MKSGLLALCFAVGATSTAAAATPEWVDISGVRSGERLAFDLSSLTIDGSKRTAWVKSRFPPRSFTTGSTPIVQILALELFDCGRRTVQLTQEIDSDATGATVKVFNLVDNPIPPYGVAPGTIDQATLDAVCAAPNKNRFPLLDEIRTLIDRVLH